MGRIKDTNKYVYDTLVSADDYLIGSDAENNGLTKNFRIGDITAYVLSELPDGSGPVTKTSQLTNDGEDGTDTYVQTEDLVSPTGLEAIDEGNGIGWRLIGRDPANYGPIGDKALDGSTSLSPSIVLGALGDYSGIFSGQNNRTTGEHSFIGGGLGNSALGQFTVLGGGENNNVGGLHSVLVGGGRNAITGLESVLIGGTDNFNSGDTSVLLGGSNNTLSGNRSGILSGIFHTVSADNSVVVSGIDNETTGEGSVILGGADGIGSGYFSTILGGGYNNTASGNYTLLFGRGGFARSQSEMVLGPFPTDYTPISTSFDVGDRLFNIANGTSSLLRSDAFTILKNAQTGIGISNFEANTTGELLQVNGTGKFSGTLKVGAYTFPATDGANTQVLQTNGSGVLSWVTNAGGDALVANPLSQFAATTKAQLNGVISDGVPLYVGDVTSNVSTNLSEGTTTNTTVDINSSDGTNATINAASTSRAGVMSKATFDAVTANTAKVGVTIEEANPPVVSQAEAEAGTAILERTWTAERVKQAIDALAPTVDDTLTKSSTIVTSRNATLSDADGINESTSATDVTITIQDNATLAIPIDVLLSYRQEGAGSVILVYNGTELGRTYRKGDIVTGWQDGTVDNWKVMSSPRPIYETFDIATSDLTTDLTTGTDLGFINVPFDMVITEVRQVLFNAGTVSGITTDINVNGSSILSTKLTTDATEETSDTAATPAVLSSTSLSKGDKITIDHDAVGTGQKGASTQIIGYRL